MKIYSQGDQAIIIDIEQEVAEDVTKFNCCTYTFIK